MKLSQGLAAAILLAAAPGLLAQDHPLVPSYPGAKLEDRKVKEFDEFELPTGPIWDGRFQKTVKLEGKVTHLKYKNPPERSTLEIFRNYENVLSQAGFKTLFRCKQSECGNSNANTKWLGFFWPSAPRKDERYLAARKADTYVSLYVSEYNHATHLNVIETGAMEQRIGAAGSAPADEASSAAQESFTPLGEDHPLVPIYPGSALQDRKIVEFDEFQLPVAKMWDHKFTKTLPLEGKITVLVYSHPEKTSSLQIFRNYEEALTKAGFQFLYKCNREECGRGDTHTQVGSFAPGYDTRYMALKFTRGGGEAYLTVNISGYYHKTWAVVLEVKPMEYGMAAAPTEARDATATRPQRPSLPEAAAPQAEEEAPQVRAPARAPARAARGARPLETGVIQGLSKLGLQAKAGAGAQGADILVEGKIETVPLEVKDGQWKWARSTVSVSLKDGKSSKVFAQFDLSDRQASADYNEAVRRSHQALAKKVAEKVQEAITSYFENQ